MALTQTDNRIIGSVHDIFHSPESLLKNFFVEKKIPLKTALKIHYQLWMIAPVVKIIHNLIWKVWSLIAADGNFRIFSGVITSFLIYPVLLGIVYLMDRIRNSYIQKTDKKKELSNPQYLFVITFLPFSTSAIFWFFPAPLNFFMIVFSLGYSVYLSYDVMKNHCRMTKAKIVEIFLVAVLFILTLAFLFTIPLNIIRTIIN